MSHFLKPWMYSFDRGTSCPYGTTAARATVIKPPEHKKKANRPHQSVDIDLPLSRARSRCTAFLLRLISRLASNC